MNDLTKPAFNFIGGQPAIDFVNTEILSRGKPKNLLQSFNHLVAWLVQIGLLEKEEGEMALKRWGGTSEAEAVLEEALALRGVLRSIVVQLADGERVKIEQIEAINNLLRHQAGYLEVQEGESGFSQQFVRSIEAPVHLLVPIAEAAADFLDTADFSLLKKCENPKCIRFFYDSTKNHSRRWCSMDACGNRMKVAAYYRRKRADKK